MSAGSYDAVLIMSFGGPEGMADILPFLDNVLRGRNVPEERKREVAHHYEAFGGVSPINAQNRALKAALEAELAAHEIDLPVYWGNRNWHPMIADTMAAMTRDGVKRALVFATSGFSSYSGCRQYREDIERARQIAGPDAPVCDKIRMFYNHPSFIEVTAGNLRAARERLPAELRAEALTLFTAHSIPMSMASTCAYEAQLLEASKLVAEMAGIGAWRLVYQSRSGPPGQPWLEPDVCAALDETAKTGARAAVLVPIGFLVDHMEVIYDLDHEAKQRADALGLKIARAATPGTHPLFVSMIRELIQERLNPALPKRALGARGPNHDVCPVDCCPAPMRPAR